MSVSDAPSAVDAQERLTLPAVRQVLAQRLAALRAGDAAAFLARLDPANTALVSWQERLLRNLPRFAFKQLDYRLAQADDPPPEKDDSYLVSVVHVLQSDADSGPPGVVPGELYAYRFARRGDRWVVLDIAPMEKTIYKNAVLQDCAAPWNLDDLQVARAGKITVAAPGHVDGIQHYADVAAQEAAKVARVWGKRASYPGAVIFLAPDDATMGRWYRASVTTPGYAAYDGLTMAFSLAFRKNGEAYQGGSAASRITVNLAHLAARGSSASDVHRLMRHELVHALTARVYSGAQQDPARWALEGFARFMEHERLSPASAAVVAAGVRAGWFTGALPANERFYSGGASHAGFNYDLSASLFAFVAADEGLATAVELYAQAASLSEAGGDIMNTPRMDAVSRGLTGRGSARLLAAWGDHVRAL